MWLTEHVGLSNREKLENTLNPWWSNRVNSAIIYWNEVGFEEIAEERNQDLLFGHVEFDVTISMWHFKEDITN